MQSLLDRQKLSTLKLFDDYFASLDALRFDVPSAGVPESWFLGPKAENINVLVDLVRAAIQQHAKFRRQYQPADPKFITASVKATRKYRSGVAALRRHANELYAMLQGSVPLFSMRYQAHMLWDQALPAMVGYFAAMLYNQNNVAAEASPLTTELEIRVGNDLCRMLGYPVPTGKLTPGTTVPWGHITCDGSVANIEALWAARNVKYFPIALQTALRESPILRPAGALEVKLLDGTSKRLADQDTWTLLNLKIDDVVGLPDEIKTRFGISLDAITRALHPYGIQNVGILEFYRRFMSGVTATPIAITPATRHYSWPKAGTLLGIGQDSILRVPVDRQARMRVDALTELLQSCLRDRIPVLAVVAVIGTTEESAVDPLRDIIEVRKQFRTRGLDFAIHCDAAWGGYFSSLLRKDVGGDFVDAVPEYPMSEYAQTQYKMLREADSITVDPHKAGYAPYPAGGLCYRNSALRDLISLKAPVIFHNQLEQTVGVYGIEGSKPGAAAAAVFLSHKVIRPTQTGYGKILGKCLWTSKRMYARLVTMTDPQFTITFLQQLPAEADNGDPQQIADQKKYIRDHFVNCTNEQLRITLKDPDAAALFAKLGSDQVIISFAFNYFISPGVLNDRVDKANQLNSEVYKICSLSAPAQSMKDLNKLKLILTSSDFDPGVYGQPFVDAFAKRMGLQYETGVPIAFLLSTTMDPWTTDIPRGRNFQKKLERVLRDAVHQAITKL